MRNKISKPDYPLFLTTLALIFIGFLILFSVSVFLAGRNLANPYYFLFHQLFFGLILGGILGIISFKLPLARLRRLSLLLFFVNIIFLSFVFIPGFGWRAGGATSWLRIGNLTFQPSEFLKITLPFYLATLLSYRKDSGRKLPKRLFKEKSILFQEFLPFLAILFLVSLPLVFQPDLGTLLLLIITAILMYFVAKTSFIYNLFLFLLFSLVFLLLIFTKPYRAERIKVFFNPEFEPLGAGYQIRQSIIAIGSGGIFGKGLGLSQQKLGFLPQTLSDSIFAVFAEETGFLGVLILLALFCCFCWRGLKIAKDSRDYFFRLLSFGITCQIAIQAFSNIGALVGLLPLSGVPLPFISYGSSHLITELVGVGILLNISKNLNNIENI